MKPMGVAFYEGGKFVKFIPIDKDGKLDDSFHILTDDTTAYIMYAQEESLHIPPRFGITYAVKLGD